MKVMPAKGPMLQSEQTFQTSNNSDARSKAISMLTSAQTPIPVNANNISAEEIGAVRSATVEQRQLQDVSANTEEATEAPVITEEKPKEDPLQSQYQILARREKALRAKVQQQEQAIKAKEVALAEKQAALDAQIAEIQSKYVSRERIKNDSFAVLEEEGVNYDQLTQQILNPIQRDPRTEAMMSKLEAKIASLQDALDNGTKAQVQQQDQSYKAALNQIKTDVASLVKGNPEFEAIERTGSTQDVVDLIEATYKETGVVMSNEEAAIEVESYLIDEAIKLTNLNKIKRRLASNGAGSTATPSAQTTAGNPPKQQQPMKTLTNATASSRTLGAKERAILAFKGELK